MLENSQSGFYQNGSRLNYRRWKSEGIRTSLESRLRAKSVVLTNGTFLNGKIHIGEKQFGGGRAGESAAYR
jgi:tRNA uridine 5-carboxymethylaminomethyl modification enzyme